MNCRTIRLTAITPVLCCLFFYSAAQCPDPAELNITATFYTQENGLASNMLAGIAKDSTGYRYLLGIDGKWIRYDGVNFGAKAYDRYSFFRYGFRDFASDEFTRQYEGYTLYKHGKNKNGITYKWGVNGDSLIWVDAFNNKKYFQFPASVDGKSPIDFFPNAEFCWITTPDKVYRFDIHLKKFIIVEIPAQKESFRQTPLLIFSRSDGSTFLLMGNTLCKLDSKLMLFQKFCTFSQIPDLAPFPEIIMDRYLFVVSLNGIVYEADLANAAINRIDLRSYTNIKNAEALKITSLKNYNNYLLIGTANAGLLIFNRCKNSIQHFQYEKQNVNDLTNSVTWLAVDDENVIWMQTDAGLVKLEMNNQRIKTYMPSAAKSGGLCNNCNNVRAIYDRDKNNLLIGSLQGVYNLDLTSGKFSDLISPVDKKPVWSDIPISAITGDGKGNIFIASWGNKGIFLLNNDMKALVNILPSNNHPELSYSNLRCLLYDAHHVLWVGTSEGILRITNLDEFEKNNFKGELNVINQFPEKGEQSAMRAGPCFAVTEDRNGNIWIGCVDGLYIYDYKTGSVTKYIHVPGNAGSISDNEVRSIYFSRDNDVWIGTNNGGLNHFDVSKKTFTAFTTDNGLPNNSIYTILKDHNGFLWLGTNAGLCRFNTTDHSVRNYTPRDGIQNFEFNTNAVAVTNDGRFCFGGRTGFNIFSPDSMNTSFSPPQVVITSFKIFGKEFPVTASVLHLAHDQNSFTFDFAALNYYRSSDNQYAYMMEGADKDWIKSGNRHYTSYNNLPPGEYTFKVKAANYTGAWNDAATSMHFVIGAAWYNTLWFRIAIAAFIVAGIYALYRYRLRQVLKLQAVRNRIASDLHDEIGSTLSSISLSSTIIQSKLNGKNIEVEKLLQQVSSNTDNMMEALSDIVWAINTRNDRFDNVVNRMRAFAIGLLEPHNINIRFNVNEDMQDIQLNMQQRKNLYLVFKEAMNNIAKYAACKNVSIDFYKEGSKTFLLHIKDDGKGFEMNITGREAVTLSGNGIRNMKKRAEELGGELNIESVCSVGTTVKLSITI